MPKRTAGRNAIEAGAICLCQGEIGRACDRVAGADDDARLLAGGQSLIATLNMRLSAPKLLIDINGIGGLDRHRRRTTGMIEIGALTRHAKPSAPPTSPGTRR